MRLLEAQDGRCNWCGLKFIPGDIIEVDHIKPKKLGGSDTYDNLQLLHGHCHDQKSLKFWIEEPCDGKLSSTVLNQG